MFHASGHVVAVEELPHRSALERELQVMDRIESRGLHPPLRGGQTFDNFEINYRKFILDCWTDKIGNEIPFNVLFVMSTLPLPRVETNALATGE